MLYQGQSEVDTSWKFYACIVHKALSSLLHCYNVERAQHHLSSTKRLANERAQSTDLPGFLCDTNQWESNDNSGKHAQGNRNMLYCSQLLAGKICLHVRRHAQLIKTVSGLSIFFPPEVNNNANFLQLNLNITKSYLQWENICQIVNFLGFCFSSKVTSQVLSTVLVDSLLLIGVEEQNPAKNSTNI